MGLEDKDLDVLQNIEFAIVSVSRERPGLSDYNVMRALDALISLYRAESRGHTQEPISLEDPDLEVFERVQAMCEWRMGRAEQPDLVQLSPTIEKGLDEMLACLRKFVNQLASGTNAAVPRDI